MGKVKLTKVQERYFDEVRAAGTEGRVYNGRARRSVEVLERVGLVVVDWGLREQVRGNGTALVEQITVRLAPAPEATRDNATYVLRVRFDQAGDVEVDARRVRLWALARRTFWRAATGGPAFEACTRHDPADCPRQCSAMFGTYRMVLVGLRDG